MLLFNGIQLNVNDSISGRDGFITIGEQSKLVFSSPQNETSTAINHRIHVLKGAQIVGSSLNFSQQVKIQSNGEDVFRASQVHLNVSGEYYSFVVRVRITLLLLIGPRDCDWEAVSHEAKSIRLLLQFLHLPL